MRLIAIALSAFLLTLPVAAADAGDPNPNLSATPMGVVESKLEKLGQVNVDRFDPSYEKPTTVCACRDTGLVGVLAFSKIETEDPFLGVPFFSFEAGCVVRNFTELGQVGLAWGVCHDFEVLK